MQRGKRKIKRKMEDRYHTEIVTCKRVVLVIKYVAGKLKDRRFQQNIKKNCFFEKQQTILPYGVLIGFQSEFQWGDCTTDHDGPVA